MPNTFLSPEHIILMYGQGGIGKSTKCAQVAAHVWKTLGLKTRVIGADGGGYKAYKPLMDKGIVQYWAIDTWDERSIFSTLDFATKGMWPADPDVPNSEPLPCKREWRKCDGCGGDTGATGHEMVKECPLCKKKFGAGIILPKVVEPTNGMEEVGCYVFESGTAFGNLLLNRLRKVDPTGGRSIKDGDTTISALGQQHYGDAQNYLAQYIANSRTIPTKVVIWTALELRGNDDGYGKPIYGPAFPGKKLTALCLPWFTDVLHLDGVTRLKNGAPERDENGQEIVDRKIFSAPHFPPDTKPFGFAAKSSAPLGGGMPTVFDCPPTGNPMARYFEELEKAYARAGEALLG